MQKGYIIEKDDLSSLSSLKPMMERIGEALHKKYRVGFDDVIQKPDLWNRLLQRRLDQIQKEVQEGRYTPKLEIEKTLHGVIRKFLTYHIIM